MKNTTAAPTEQSRNSQPERPHPLPYRIAPENQDFHVFPYKARKDSLPWRRDG